MPVDQRTDHGEAVRNGVIHHLSASSISKANPDQYGGCFRRWLYHYVLGFKEPFTSSQALGVETHDIAEAYYKGVSDNLNALLISARHFMPPRDPQIVAEHEIPYGSLVIAGLPVVGMIDIINPTSITTDEAGDIIHDDPDIVEALDWKTTKNVLAYGKQSRQLIDTDQMSLYGRYIQEKTQYKARPRISHVYMQTQGMSVSAKATDIPDLELIEKRWQRMSEVSRALIDIAKETDPDKVPANRKACDAYQGCPQRTRCPRSREETLVDLFGLTKADEMKGKTIMSLENEMNNLGQQQAAAQNVTASAPPDAAFGAAWETVIAAGHGFPPLNPAAGAILSRVKGWEGYGGGGYAGQGEYGGLRPLSPAEVMTLAGNLVQKASPPPAEAPPQAPQPPQAPPAPPASQAPPVPAPVPYTAPEVAAAAPVPATEAAPVAAADEPEEVATCRELAKKASWTGQQLDKKGLSKAIRYLLANQGSGGAPATLSDKAAKAALKAAHEAGVIEGKALAPTGAPTTAGGLVVYVNAVPSCPSDSLMGYVQGLLRNLEKQCGAKDIRCSDHDVLSYGKWKGALAAMVREMPPSDGVYTIDTDSEITEVIAAELRFCSNIYVRGVK